MVHLSISESALVAQNTRSPYVLIVYAEQDKAHELQSYLQRQGYRVQTATYGQSALSAVYQEPPDLVVLDLVLPDMDGLTVCQRLKSSTHLGYLPIVILTDADEERQRLAGMLSGADDYLTKSFTKKELLLRVQALLRTKNQIDLLISENQMLNKYLQERNQALERALETVQQTELLKSHIIESVDHELRTPMLQVKSAVSMLADVIKENSSPERDHNISRIARMSTKAVARLEELINNVSQLNSAQGLKLTPTILNDAITQSMHLLRRSWSHQDHMERVSINSETVPPVLADRRAVSRLLFILVDNALKFSGNAPIEIHCKQVDSHTVSISVTDYGIGIAPEHHALIFETFYQVERGTTKRFGGVGVGLALAQMIARGMNTTIEVQSEPQKGSTFSFKLAIADLSSTPWQEEPET